MKKSLRFPICDCKAIGNALIEIDGITVITGVNGSGKTTVAKKICNMVAARRIADMPMPISHAVLIGGPKADSGKRREESLVPLRADGPASHPSKKAKKIITYIAHLLGGYIKIGGEAAGDGLVFRSHDDYAIPLDRLAAGKLIMACLGRLLANRTIDGKTLLIIDTPETGLHPQWIAEMARVLVWMHKKIGARVLLCTVSPEFIRAVKAIANKENVLKRTRFYLAEEIRCDEGKYAYRDLGQETYDIFKQFNKLYEKIDQYGLEDYED